MNNYEILPNGVIHQKKIVNKLKDYDKKYVEERYNSYGEKGLQMAYLRLGFLNGVVPLSYNSTILDIGYGNGDFLKVCNDAGLITYGNDISNYPLPKGSVFVDDILKHEFDVVCFFDSLEHFGDISFVKELKTEYIYISVPYCHNFSEEWFMNWKHRREDEHLWHFNKLSLNNFMSENDFECVAMSGIEDIIRKGETKQTNILTGIFKKI